MGIWDVAMLLGGLAFFLYGMQIMSSGLEKSVGGKLERVLRKMTSNPIKALGLGAGITFAIQSSSAMTVMLVGLVNSSVMTLGQSIGVIMGSNIGTTLKAWIFALAGIESGGNILLELLKPENFSPIVALIGVILIMVNKGRKKDLGSILVGFAILMFGMDLMGESVAGLGENSAFQNILISFSKNPILGVLAGTLVTGIIQSSSASVGILIAIAQASPISMGVAIPIIMGQNIGTCATALISSIGVSKNAKRVAAVHILFNIIGTGIFLGAFYLLDFFLNFAFVDEAVSAFGIAVIHTIFNVATTLILLPFTKLLEKLARLIVKDKPDEKEFAFIDERLLNTPSFAVGQCRTMTVEMAKLARETFLSAIECVNNYDLKISDLVFENESKLDMYEDKLGSFLVKLSSAELTYSDSLEISKMLHSISDMERIGDHAVNVMFSAKALNDKGYKFSEAALAELKVITDALREILDITTDAYEKGSLELARKVEPLEQVIDGLIDIEKKHHILRLRSGECVVEAGVILNEIVTNYERVSDHCSNIAVCMIEVDDAEFNTHSYLNELKNSGDETFISEFNSYREKYNIQNGISE